MILIISDQPHSLMLLQPVSSGANHTISNHTVYERSLAFMI